MHGKQGNICFRQPNASAQPRLEAEAQRTLEGVGCSALFGSDYTSKPEFGLYL